MTTIPKFLLIENFSWLIQQLGAFKDPNITYKNQGMKQLKGGPRRIYRYDKHYQAFYASATIQQIPSTVKVTFGGTNIECDQWQVSHQSFEDAGLKEKFPKPEVPYTVLLTSKKSLEDGTAKRYYCSCSCMDFETTFKEELINYGYTNGMVPPSKGVKKLAPAVCKHLYAVLRREYKDIIEAEPGAESSAEIKIAITTISPVSPLAQPKPILPTTPIQPGQVPQKSKPGKVPKTDAQKKIEYEKDIRRSLKFFSNTMPNAVEVYKNTRQSDNSFKKYKFMIKKYFQGWVIVFTNPQLNPMRDKIREKEMVPLMARTSKGMIPTGDAIVVYTKYFTKDELQNIIKSESRPIQQNQIDKIAHTFPKYTLTESMELTTTSIRSLLMEIC